MFEVKTEPHEIEIWRDGRPVLSLSPARGNLVPAANGAFTLPDGTRCYRDGAAPNLSWKEAHALALEMCAAMNAAAA